MKAWLAYFCQPRTTSALAKKEKGKVICKEIREILMAVRKYFVHVIDQTYGNKERNIGQGIGRDIVKTSFTGEPLFLPQILQSSSIRRNLKFPTTVTRKLYKFVRLISTEHPKEAEGYYLLAAQPETFLKRGLKEGQGPFIWNAGRVFSVSRKKKNNLWAYILALQKVK